MTSSRSSTTNKGLIGAASVVIASLGGIAALHAQYVVPAIMRQVDQEVSSRLLSERQAVNELKVELKAIQAELVAIKLQLARLDPVADPWRSK